jgi:hypothetical protein
MKYRHYNDDLISIDNVQKKENLNIDGQQFYQYQQNKQ